MVLLKSVNLLNLTKIIGKDLSIKISNRVEFQTSHLQRKKGCVLLKYRRKAFILGRLFCGRDQTVRATSGIDAFFVQD